MHVTDADETEQLELLPSPRRRAPRAPRAVEPAADLPVARVLVDTGLAHLDRPFDYLVTAQQSDAAVVGCRVRVRFAGQLADGFVVERAATSDHDGRLMPLVKVVSNEPVLSPAVLRLAREVAARYAGTVGDVLRLAIPPRHARTERAASPVSAPPPRDARPEAWSDYPLGPELVEALSGGASPRAAWSALPSPDPAVLVAEAVLATVRGGRGAIVCVPDGRDVTRWRAVLADAVGEALVVLTGSQDPADRYASFLAASRGAARVVLGTRAAAFAPVADLGLLVLWDDGDDLYAEPRAPYPHTREVVLLRAEAEGAGVLLAAHARTAEVQSLVEGAWCSELVPSLEARRTRWPRVEVADGTDTGGVPVRLPRQVFAQVRAATGPVLVQVPRRGYRTSLACQDCRTPARCAACEGPLVQHAAGAPPVCRWCGAAADPWRCRACGSARLRAPVVGQLRTAEEVARAFPDHEVVTSGGQSVLAEAPAGRTIVLATPGAEPPVAGGYALVVLLDTWLMLARDDVRVVEEAHRRWFNALALGAPGSAAVVVGDASGLQALVRADPTGLARRELADRRDTRLPPVGRLASVEGDVDVLDELAARPWTEHIDVLGPVPHDPRDASVARLVLRAPRREGAELADRLAAVAAERSATKLPAVRIQVDPQRF